MHVSFSFHKAADDAEFRTFWNELNDPKNAEKAINEFLADPKTKVLLKLLEEDSKALKRLGKKESTQ